MNDKIKVSALVHRGDPQLVIPEDPVPVTVDFDLKRMIGTAKLYRDMHGNIGADFELIEMPEGTPAIGTRGDEILTVGICFNGNIDPAIGVLPAIPVERSLRR